MFDLKPLNPSTIAKAIQKADRYRLLNEPEQAESICLDILLVAPDHPEALIILILALSDQFRTDHDGRCSARAQELVSRLPGEYERAYYSGILAERRGSASLDRGGTIPGGVAFRLFRQAMDWYEKAEAVRPPDNDDAPLRWNTCARLLQKHHLAPAEQESYEPSLME